MKFKDDESFYYRFELAVDFVSGDIAKTYARKEWARQHATKNLGEFAAKTFVGSELQVMTDRLVLITKEQEKIQEMKRFCHYMVESEILYNLTVAHVLEKFDLDALNKGLEQSYEKYKFYYKLSNEVAPKAEETKKKPKV